MEATGCQIMNSILLLLHASRAVLAEAGHRAVGPDPAATVWRAAATGSKVLAARILWPAACGWETDSKPASRMAAVAAGAAQVGTGYNTHTHTHTMQQGATLGGASQACPHLQASCPPVAIMGPISGVPSLAQGRKRRGMMRSSG